MTANEAKITITRGTRAAHGCRSWDIILALSLASRECYHYYPPNLLFLEKVKISLIKAIRHFCTMQPCHLLSSDIFYGSTGTGKHEESASRFKWASNLICCYIVFSRHQKSQTRVSQTWRVSPPPNNWDMRQSRHITRSKAHFFSLDLNYIRVCLAKISSPLTRVPSLRHVLVQGTQIN